MSFIQIFWNIEVITIGSRWIVRMENGPYTFLNCYLMLIISYTPSTDCFITGSLLLTTHINQYTHISQTVLLSPSLPMTPHLQSAPGNTWSRREIRRAHLDDMYSHDQNGKVRMARDGWQLSQSKPIKIPIKSADPPSTTTRDPFISDQSVHGPRPRAVVIIVCLCPSHSHPKSSRSQIRVCHLVNYFWMTKPRIVSWSVVAVWSYLCELLFSVAVPSGAVSCRAVVCCGCLLLSLTKRQAQENMKCHL